MTGTSLAQALRSDEVREAGELLESRQSGAEMGDLRDHETAVSFSREHLDTDLWEPKQADIARSVAENRFTVVLGANSVGKDRAAACISLWAAYSRRMLVLVTASAERTAGGVFMRRELAPLFRQAGDLPGELYSMELRVPDSRAGIVAMTSTSASKLTGFHHPKGVLTILSEAQDVEPFAWEAMQANATSERARALACGNPLRPTGRLYEVAQKSHWHTIRIPASEHPNVRKGREVIPGGPTQAWIEGMRQEWGEESPQFIARVKARFPEELEGGMFRREWLDEAARRYKEGTLGWEAQGEEPVMAVDPARRGPDASALAVREGPVVREVRTWEGKMDTMELVERIRGAATEVGVRPTPEPRHHEYGDPQGSAYGRLVVDEIGVGGGVLDRLKELGYRTDGFNAGSKAGDQDRFHNRRAEVFWALRERLEEGNIALPRDEQLYEELMATRWRPTPKGRVQLESKEDLKSRIGRSPDRADAVAMSLAEPKGGFFFVGRA